MFFSKVFSLRFENKLFIASNLTEAKELIAKHEFKIVIVDKYIATERGEDFARFLDKNYPTTVYYFSSSDDEEIKSSKNAINLGKIYNDDFFNKLKKLCPTLTTKN
jgi:response regulator of citrate/malate metabolism